MKRQSLVKGLLALTVVSVMTGCVDDKYDLTDIDTTSRFTVDNLTVPVNLSEIKLKNVVNLDDNDLIEKVVIDGKECYSIVKGGEIAKTEFSLNPIHVESPSLNPSIFNVPLPGGGSTVSGEGVELPAINFPDIPLQDYNFDMHNVDKALLELKNIKTSAPLQIEVALSIPQGLTGSNNYIAFQNLEIQLPWGLETNQEGYDQESGLLSISELPVESDGMARLKFAATGLDLLGQGKVEAQELNINGKVGIKKGQIKIIVNDVTLPANLEIRADYSVSAFEVAYFSGKINYNMEGIDIAPIELNDLPDFLDSPETKLYIANPQILVNITNPVGKYNLVGKGKIILTSDFNGTPVDYSSGEFTINEEQTKLAFCTPKEGYSDVQFDALRDVLANGNSGLPKNIEVKIDDINFAGDVTDFPLGDLGTAEGSYEFNAPLGFGKDSVVIYETTEGDWGSDDLEKVNIKVINLSAECTTNLPVGITLSIVPVDRNGNVIEVNEDNAGFEVPAYADKSPVTLKIAAKNGGTISGFDGVKFRAIVDQRSENNTEALGPDQQIKLDNIRVTVDGYYETDF